jgi:3-hydroxyacyl-CoA dehydrogenase
VSRPARVEPIRRYHGAFPDLHIDIDRIAASTTRPQAVVGTHFFSPAHVMKLLENVRGRATSAQVIRTVMDLGNTLGKVTVLAGNADGFITDRHVSEMLIVGYPVLQNRKVRIGHQRNKIGSVLPTN